MKNYLRFGVMIATSIIVMFMLMYLDTYRWEHIFFSDQILYMAIMMGGAMAIIMMGFMFKMYKKKLVNIFIFIGSFLIIVLAIFLLRSQATTGDVSFMRSMIPHHSQAIIRSERANITDTRVQELANEII